MQDKAEPQAFTRSVEVEARWPIAIGMKGRVWAAFFDGVGLPTRTMPPTGVHRTRRHANKPDLTAAHVLLIERLFLPLLRNTVLLLRLLTTCAPGTCSGAMRGVLGAAILGQQAFTRMQVRSRKRAVNFFGWVFFLISSGSPHVRPMGRTCGEPDEIELTAMGVELNGSRMQAVDGVVSLAKLLQVVNKDA